MNTTKTPQSTHTDAELFRTWWVGLPLERAKEVQQTIKEKLGWSSNTWYDRTSGRTNFQPAEKALIIQIAGENPFLRVEVQP